MNQELIISIFLDALILVFLSIAFVISIDILKNWDYKTVTLQQVKLQKKVYLTSVILSYVVAVKICLFFLFLYTLDELSNIITGAMCSIGVLENTQVGGLLICLKAFIILFCSLWLLLFKRNQQDKTLSYTKILYFLYFPLFFLTLLEFSLLIIMTNSIDIDKIVSCCSTVFSIDSDTSSSQSLFNINSSFILGFYLFIYLLSFYKNKIVLAFIGAVFFVTSIVAITSFFSPYIYELPNHKCPFCIMQKEYYYVGYLIYILLFSSLYYSIASLFLYLCIKKECKNYYKYVRILNTLILFILFFYVGHYYYLNGVFL